MNPIFIKHRVNRTMELVRVDPSWGVEIDLRSHPETKDIYLSHDPFTPGDRFIDWLAEFERRGIQGPLILNVKEDGLEERILEIMAKSPVNNFFFLDATIPTLVKWALRGNTRFAIRVSSYEPVETLAKFDGLVSWVWVDCFNKEPLSAATLKKWAASFQLCLVSPELQGGSVEDAAKFRELASLCTAICTKDPTAWQAVLSNPALTKSRR